jgi:hypothetical protein
MKKVISIIVTVLACCCLSVSSFAQDEQPNYAPAVPKWVSEKGYWIIESNIKTPENSIIYFYNNDNELVYKEKIEGVQINLKKKRVLMQLKTILEQSISAWDKQHILKQNEMLVTLALKK